MKTTQDRQKSYANKRRRPLEFEVWDQVFVNVALWKYITRFGMKGKQVSRYIGSFEIVQGIDLVAYKLDIPLHLSKIHDVFYISLLQKA